LGCAFGLSGVICDNIYRTYIFAPNIRDEFIDYLNSIEADMSITYLVPFQSSLPNMKQHLTAIRAWTKFIVMKLPLDTNKSNTNTTFRSSTITHIVAKPVWPPFPVINKLNTVTVVTFINIIIK